jgi:hypothetical protein
VSSYFPTQVITRTEYVTPNVEVIRYLITGRDLNPDFWVHESVGALTTKVFFSLNFVQLWI